VEIPLYKNWGKFNQRIRERGGKLTSPFPKPKAGRVRKKKTVVISADLASAHRVREWKRYIADCCARGITPKNIPPEIRRALGEKVL